MDNIRVFESRGLKGREAHVEEVKVKAAELLDLMESIQPTKTGEHVRYFALAKTALEESVMWHVKGVSRMNK